MPIKYKSIPKNAIKIPLPDSRQYEDFSCGAVALQSILGYYGKGLEEEWTLIKELKIDPRVGTNPNQLERFAKKLGYKIKIIQPMSLKELKNLLKQKKPVIMMIQAWKDFKKMTKSYAKDWADGHWVVAIGYDKTGIYFEDPELTAIRGYIPYKELEQRWHDIDAHNRHIHNYGMAIWKPLTKKPAYLARARFIS